MAKYEVLETSFIDNRLVEAGTVVEINDDPKKGGMKPGSNMKPVKGSAPAAPDAGGNGGDGDKK
jgi:hypothetical protein